MKIIRPKYRIRQTADGTFIPEFRRHALDAFKPLRFMVGDEVMRLNSYAAANNAIVEHKKQNVPKHKDVFHYIPMKPTTQHSQTPKPPKGWRWLRVGERIRHDDQIKGYFSGVWTNSILSGGKVYEKHIYIRRIRPARAARRGK